MYRENTTKILNLIYAAQSSKFLFLLLSANTEKAFDRVVWPSHVGHPATYRPRLHMQWWILYSNPLASVRVNETQSKFFRLPVVQDRASLS